MKKSESRSPGRYLRVILCGMACLFFMPGYYALTAETGNAANEPTEEAEQKAEEAAERAAEQAAEEAEEAAEQAAEEAEEAAERAAEQAAQEAEEAAERAAQEAEEAAEQAAEEAEEAAERTAEEAEEAEKQAEKAAQEAQRLADRDDPEDDEDTGDEQDRGADEDVSEDGEVKGARDRQGQDAGPASAARMMAARSDEFDDLYDDDGFEAVADEILLLAEADRVMSLEETGYAVAARQYLEGLDMVLVRMTAPKEAELSDSAAALSAREERAEVDLNHLFAPESETAFTQEAFTQEAAYSTADLSGQMKLNGRPTEVLSLGLIDTMVDQSHAAFLAGNILIRDLVPYERTRPRDHGTAVASILVGDEPGVFRGMVPSARLYAASVFFEISPGKTVATTESLILALDWLLRKKVRVINMSLSGPPNKLLEAAVRRVAEKGGVIIAAVGNGGAASSPLYPAAYPGVVAVTAVDQEQHVYLRANRGSHVAFSAPGVDIPVARAGGGYQAQSGTSLAAPFVSAVIADMMNRHERQSPRDTLETLQKNSLDLGAPGFDNIYGHGLIRPVAD